MRRRLHIPCVTQMAGKSIRVVRAPTVKTDDAFGHFRWVDWQITIDNGLDIEMAENTYVHELIEAANKMGELGLAHWKIEVLGSLLHQALTTEICNGKGKQAKTEQRQRRSRRGEVAPGVRKK